MGESTGGKSRRKGDKRKALWCRGRP